MYKLICYLLFKYIKSLRIPVTSRSRLNEKAADEIDASGGRSSGTAMHILPPPTIIATITTSLIWYLRVDLVHW